VYLVGLYILLVYFVAHFANITLRSKFTTVTFDHFVLSCKHGYVAALCYQVDVT
jgi:hypothetical protein